MKMEPSIPWPSGKSFAFTVFDDTDLGSVENLKPVYDYLLDTGFRTTKSVWILGGTQPAKIGGATCADPVYLQWVLDLQKDGFEIGWHNATFHSSYREDTLRGLEEFRHHFGQYPSAMTNHATCREGIYWGENRVTGLQRLAYNALTLRRRKGWFHGHVEGDDFFWGDLCKSHLKYVRNFVFNEINTFKSCPWMPYSDLNRPYVNSFFASSEGRRLDDFVMMIAEANQDRLEEEGGCCIMYTHFACGFWHDGGLDTRFKFLMQRLRAKNGWFVPVTELLDHIAKVRGHIVLTPRARRQLECRWLADKIAHGSS